MIDSTDPSAASGNVPAPTQGFVVGNSLIVHDVERARAFYEKMFGAKTVLVGESATLRLANSWLVLDTKGGGPTDDKPNVVSRRPQSRNIINSVLNVYVADIEAFYKLWLSRGSEFLTEPIVHRGDKRCYIRDPDGYIIEVGQFPQSPSSIREDGSIEPGVGIFCVISLGLIAGQMLAIGIADYAVRGLPEESWTLRFQQENDLYTKTMPVSLMSPLLSATVATILGRGRSRSMYALATLFTVVVTAITFALEIPINVEVSSWTAGKAPANWTLVRDRWLKNHAVRVVAGILALVFGAIGLAREGRSCA